MLAIELWMLNGAVAGPPDVILDGEDMQDLVLLDRPSGIDAFFASDSDTQSVTLVELVGQQGTRTEITADTLIDWDGDGVGEPRLEPREGLEVCELTVFGDFDGNGNLDRAGAGCVWLSDGKAYDRSVTFVSYADDPFPGWAVSAGDLDRDGRTDLLRILLDEPSGGSPPAYGVGGLRVPVPYGEFDLAEGHYELHLGADLRADGTWPARWSFRPETHAAVLASAFIDVDLDGSSDLVAWVESQDQAGIRYEEVGVWSDLLSRTGPVEMARQSRPTREVFSRIQLSRMLPVGDWDGDGDEEALLTSNWLGADVRHVLDLDLDDLLRTTEVLELPTPSEEGVIRSFAADFDGDGGLDIAVGALNLDSEPGGSLAYWSVKPLPDLEGPGDDPELVSSGSSCANGGLQVLPFGLAGLAFASSRVRRRR